MSLSARECPGTFSSVSHSALGRIRGPLDAFTGLAESAKCAVTWFDRSSVITYSPEGTFRLSPQALQTSSAGEGDPAYARQPVLSVPRKPITAGKLSSRHA
jgi:hypothetical protein